MRYFKSGYRDLKGLFLPLLSLLVILTGLVITTNLTKRSQEIQRSSAATCNTCYNFNGSSDGLVDVQDVAAVANRWGLVATDPNYNSIYDIYCSSSNLPDGSINVLDTQTVSNRWGSSSCTPSAPPSGCKTADTTSWQTFNLSTQTGAFSVEFDATPNQTSIDGVSGLSNNTPLDYMDLAAIVRFNPSGTIDARNAGVYQAQSTISYTAGQTYHFKMDVNTNTKTYSAYVTPQGGSQVTIGVNYAFRTEQANATSFNYLVIHDQAGSHEVCNVTVGGNPITPQPSVNPSPTPTPLPTPTSGGPTPTFPPPGPGVPCDTLSGVERRFPCSSLQIGPMPENVSSGADAWDMFTNILYTGLSDGDGINERFSAVANPAGSGVVIRNQNLLSDGEGHTTVGTGRSLPLGTTECSAFRWLWKSAAEFPQRGWTLVWQLQMSGSPIVAIETDQSNHNWNFRTRNGSDSGLVIPLAPIQYGHWAYFTVCTHLAEAPDGWTKVWFKQDSWPDVNAAPFYQRSGHNTYQGKTGHNTIGIYAAHDGSSTSYYGYFDRYGRAATPQRAIQIAGNP